MPLILPITSISLANSVKRFLEAFHSIRLNIFLRIDMNPSGGGFSGFAFGNTPLGGANASAGTFKLNLKDNQ